MTKPRLASIWLDGCSGCHMSFLDIDERLVELAHLVEFVWGPFVDMKKFPEAVDITLVEGAVSSEEDLHKLRMVREHSKMLIAFGDCAITGNVPAMRNPFGVQACLERAYIENVTENAQLPGPEVPALLPRTTPVHEIVKVDAFLPGCPPSADLIWATVTALLEGRPLESTAKFG